MTNQFIRGRWDNLVTLEAVVWELEGQRKQLTHYYHDDPEKYTNYDTPWQKGKVICTDANSQGAIIQSNFGSSRGNFDVLVGEGDDVAHYWRDNTKGDNPWVKDQILPGAMGPASFIQYEAGSATDKGTFEAVARDRNEPSKLWHWTRDNRGDRIGAWTRVALITSKATGPGCIAMATGPTSLGRFEVVVPEGRDLVQYFHDNASQRPCWQRGEVICETAVGSACITEVEQNGTKHLQVVAWQDASTQDCPVLGWYRLDGQGGTWNEQSVLAMKAMGPATLVQTKVSGRSSPPVDTFFFLNNKGGVQTEEALQVRWSHDGVMWYACGTVGQKVIG